MSTKKIELRIGPTWPTLVGVIFVILKVTGVTQVAEWDWWLVLLPFYFGFAIVAAVLAFTGLAAGILLLAAGFCELVDYLHNRWRRRK